MTKLQIAKIEREMTLLLQSSERIRIDQKYDTPSQIRRKIDRIAKKEAELQGMHTILSALGYYAEYHFGEGENGETLSCYTINKL